MNILTGCTSSAPAVCAPKPQAAFAQAMA